MLPRFGYGERAASAPDAVSATRDGLVGLSRPGKQAAEKVRARGGHVHVVHELDGDDRLSWQAEDLVELEQGDLFQLDVHPSYLDGWQKLLDPECANTTPSLLARFVRLGPVVLGVPPDAVPAALEMCPAARGIAFVHAGPAWHPHLASLDQIAAARRAIDAWLSRGGRDRSGADGYPRTASPVLVIVSLPEHSRADFLAWNDRRPATSEYLFTKLVSGTHTETSTFITDDVEALRAHVRAFGGEFVDEIARR